MKKGYKSYKWGWGGLLVVLALSLLAGGQAQAQLAPASATVTPKEGALEVEWPPAKEAARYKVQWGETVTSGTQTYPGEHTVMTGTSYTIPNLKAGTVYLVRVIAVNAGGDESTPTNAALPSGTTATVITPLPGQVQNVRVTAGVSGTSTSLVVTWDPVDGVRAAGGSGRYRVDWGASPVTSDGTRHEIDGLVAATEYTVKVFALNDGGDGAASDSKKGRPLPPEVQAVTVAAHADPGKLTVTWTAQVAADATGDAAGAATGYKVQWKSGSQRFGTDRSREASVTPGTMATYDITGLEGIQHTVRVIAVNASGDGARGDDPTDPSVATGTPKPGKVQNVRVTAHNDPQKLTVSWDRVMGAGYRVRWKKADADEYAATDLIPTTGQITATSTTIPASGAGNLDGVPYMVQVVAVNGSEDPADKEYSSPATGTPKPGPVTDLTAAGGTDELTVSWTAATGANNYTFQWKSATENYTSGRQRKTSETKHIITGLTAGTYTVRVWASNASGDGLPVESTSTATVTDAEDNQVTGVRVTAGVKELTVMWNSVAKATKYSVAVTAAGSPITGSPFETTRTRTVIRELTAGTSYSVTVTADVPDVTGEPASAPAVSATPKPGKVPNVTVKVPDDAQQLEVSWGSVVDADGYIIQWKSGREDYSASRQVTLTSGDEFTNRKAIIGDGDGSDTDAERDGALDGVSHMVQVIAKVGTGDALVEGDPSNPATATPKPGKPAPTVTAHDDPGKLTVKWPKVEGATRYTVQWKSEDDSDYADTRQATPTALEYTISGLSAAKVYTVQVIARNASGDGDSSDDPEDNADDVTGRPRPGRVPAVTVLSAATAGQLDVSWTKVTGATGYKVQWKSGMEDYAATRQVSLGDVAETTLGDGDGSAGAEDEVLDGIPHMVQVIAFSPSTEDTPTDQDGPASAQRTATPKPAAAAAPTVTVHADPGKLTVKWEKVEGATRYKVEWKNSDAAESDGDYASNRQASVTGLEHAISGLSAAETYIVRVTAMNASGDAVPSAESAASPNPRSAQVKNVKVAAPDEGAGQRLTVSWDEVTGPTGTVYIVECKLSTDASFTSLGAQTSPHTISSLQAGERYIFRVRASHSDPAVLGPWSAQQTGQPRPAILAGLEASTSGRMQLTVAWTAPTNEVDNYRVEWKKTTGEEYATSRQRQIPGTSTSYVIREHLDGGAVDGSGIGYTVRVRAIVNSVLGPGDSGAEATGTVMPPRPGEVTGVRVTPLVGQLRVNWNRVTRVRNYKIEWVPTPTTGDPSFATGTEGYGTIERPGSTYTIPDLMGGTNYSVQVTALDAVDSDDNGSLDADGPSSDVATGTPMAATPGRVTNVEVEFPEDAAATTDLQEDETGLAVSWKKVDGVTGYKVEWTTGSDRREQLLETNDDATDAFNEDMPSFTLPNGTADDNVTGHPELKPGTRYTVRVQAVNKHATNPGGQWSTPVTSMLKPAQVTLKDQDSETSGDQFVIPGANTLTVAWNEAAGAHSYKVQWKSGGLDYHSSRQRVLTNPTKLEYEIGNLEAGTEYTVQVTATNALGKDGDSSDDPDDTADDVTGRPQPKKVTGVRVTAGLAAGAHQLTVVWNRVPGADSYKVQWKIPGSDTEAEKTYDDTDGDRSEFGVTGTSYTIPGTNSVLTANTEYTVQVIATAAVSGGDDVDGEPSDDPEDSSDDVAGLTLPGQVALAASDVIAGANQLTVTWTAHDNGADNYRVQWKTGAADWSTSPEIPGTNTRYVIQNLKAATEYRVRVYASNASGNGQPSAEQTGEPIAPEEGQVSGLQVTEGVGQLTVSWKPVTGASGYEVLWKTDSQDYDRDGSETPPRKAEVSSGTSHTIMGLEGGTEYTVIVVALAVLDVDKDGTKENGPDSDPAVGTPNLDKVSNLEVTRVDVEFLTVSWDEVTGTGVEYKVQWKSGDQEYDSSREVDGLSGARYTISPLKAGTQYTIRVIATKGGREGEPSDEVTPTTATEPNQVAGVDTSPGENQLEVTWGEVAGASSYTVQWKSANEDYDDSPSSTRQETGVTGTSHVIPDLTPGRQYTVRVIAVVNGVDQTPSEEATGRPARATTTPPTTTPPTTPPTTTPPATTPPTTTPPTTPPTTTPPTQPKPPAVSTPSMVRHASVKATDGGLQVRWLSLAKAGYRGSLTGYKVQWKSGSESYAPAREDTATGQLTWISHVIGDLSHETEYTVRVLAFNEHGDGPPSEELTGTPRQAQPSNRIAGALRGAVRGSSDQQPRGDRVQQSSLGLGPTGHLDAGQEVMLTVSVAQVAPYVLQVTGGRGVTLSGTGVTDEGGGRAQLDEASWSTNLQRTVVLKDTAAVDTLTVALLDADGQQVAALGPRIVYNPEVRHGIRVTGLPDTLTVNRTYAGGVTLLDRYGNVRIRDDRRVVLSANRAGVTSSPADLTAGRGQFWVRSDSLLTRPLVLTFRDSEDPSVSKTETVVIRSLDAPDELVAADNPADEGGFVLLTWDLSEDHSILDGYRIYRAPAVGEPVDWGRVAADPEATEGRVVVATLDTATTAWGIAAELELEAEPGSDGGSTPVTTQPEPASSSRSSGIVWSGVIGSPAPVEPEEPEEEESDMDDEDMEPENVRRSPVSQSGSVRAVDNTAPTAVSNLTAVDVPDDDGGRILLSWTASASDRQVSRQVAGAVGPVVSDQAPGVAGYRIYRKPAESEEQFVSLGTVAAGDTAFVDTTAANGERFTYTVAAFDEDNETASEEQSAMAIRNVAADANGRAIQGLFGSDQEVGFDDYFHFADHYGSSAADAQWEPAFDLASKDAVDADGLAVFARNFGRSTGAVGKASPPREGGNPETRLEFEGGVPLPRVGEEFVLTVHLNDFGLLKGYGFQLEFRAEELELVRAVTADNRLGEGPLAAPQVLAVEDGKRAIVAYGHPVSEGTVAVDLVLRARQEFETGFLQVTRGQVRDGAYGVNDLVLPAPVELETLPEVYALGFNYPNPFNPETTIKYALPQASDVELVVYNALGQTVRTLVAERQVAGRYAFTWDATNDRGHAVSSGIYLYRLRAGEFVNVRKMLLVK